MCIYSSRLKTAQDTAYELKRISLLFTIHSLTSKTLSSIGFPYLVHCSDTVQSGREKIGNKHCCDCSYEIVVSK